MLSLVQVNNLSRVLNLDFRASPCGKLYCSGHTSKDDTDSDEPVAIADDTTRASYDSGTSALQSKVQAISEETFV